MRIFPTSGGGRRARLLVVVGFLVVVTDRIAEIAQTPIVLAPIAGDSGLAHAPGSANPRDTLSALRDATWLCPD